MKSRNYREGSYCGRTTSANGTTRSHDRSQTSHHVSAGTAARAVVARLVSRAEERRQMALAARIMEEDRNALRELARR
jgi:hypothetical protein